MSTPFSSCCPSVRVRPAAKGVKVAALALFGPALKPGAKGRAAIVFAQGPPPGALLSVSGPVGAAAAFPDQGEIWVVVVLAQIGGLLSGALAPPAICSWNELKATCGLSAKTAVSWPVWGLALTFPISRTESP